jgi:hypothetical protein
MIAWWIIPAILTVFALLSMRKAADHKSGLFEFGFAFFLCGATAALWILCLVLKVIWS